MSAIPHRNEKLHFSLEGVVQCRHLGRKDILDVPVQGEEAAEA